MRSDAGDAGVVIVGGGQAGAWVAATLRDEGFEGRIVLVGEEAHVPYERPPLSKAVLSGAQEAESCAVKPADFYGTRDIELRLDGLGAETAQRLAQQILRLRHVQRVTYRGANGAGGTFAENEPTSAAEGDLLDRPRERPQKPAAA